MDKRISKIISRVKYALTFLDWLADKFKVPTPSRAEAEKVIKEMVTDDKVLEEAYKVAEKIKRETPDDLGAIEDQLKLLASITVIANGRLPRNYLEAKKAIQDVLPKATPQIIGKLTIGNPEAFKEGISKLKDMDDFFKETLRSDLLKKIELRGQYDLNAARQGIKDGTIRVFKDKTGPEIKSLDELKELDRMLYIVVV